MTGPQARKELGIVTADTLTREQIEAELETSVAGLHVDCMDALEALSFANAGPCHAQRERIAAAINARVLP